MHGHILAAEKLGSSYSIEQLGESIPPLPHSIQRRELPTSIHRVGDSWWSGEKALYGIENLSEDELARRDPNEPLRRNRFDQFFDAFQDLQELKEKSEQDDAKQTALPVAGQVFFITNGEPIPFWDLARKVWYDYAGLEVLKPWRIPQSVGLFLGIFGELWSNLTGRPVGLNKARVQYACAQRYFNIEKSQRLLGYEPQVGLEDGIARTVAWFKAEEAAGRIHGPK